ncbi:MAG: IclR family transcriptional regulator [Deltaproteobacteria bacterium]|nr:IclR family transcriptional regulator [Deltaproteobacteria bacterium]
MEKGYIAPSVKRAFDILKAISGSRNGLGISEIARKLAMAKSSVHGITFALEELGAVRRDPHTKKFVTGPTLIELGRLAYSQIDLKDVARPIMEELMEKTDETVFLGILNGEHITILDIVESRKELKITSPRGTTIPILAGATGKVVLASMDEGKALEIIRSKGLPRYTEKSITDPEKYIQAIKTARQNGYAIDDEEYLMGVRAVAAPIEGEGDMISTIYVVGFKAAMDERKMGQLIRETKNAARLIGNKIKGR